MILEPLSQFLIEFFRNNPSDTATYYVQSVVYDSINGNVLATVKLTDKGNGYFAKLWTLPADTYGNGRQISIISSCYTDSAYTQISPIYGAELEKYVVRHLASQNLGGFTTQLNEVVRQSAIDYKKLASIVTKIVEDAQNDPYDDAALCKRIDCLLNAIRDGYATHESSIAKTIEAIAEVSSKTSESPGQITASFNNEIAHVVSQVKDMAANNKTHHAQQVALHGKTLKGVVALAKDTSVSDKLDELDKKAEARHEDLKSEVGKPVMLKTVQRTAKKDTQKKAEKDEPLSQREMTVQKLLMIAKP